ncbi:uncharacterized protein BJX67DRAFT_324299 [Aspergillus lucknowensis]|uniref:Transmembrane protein n=1 Tax=Aspergillus lucknowensis TaxID=176173 RepID=A0ABR4LZI9_9EURO
MHRYPRQHTSGQVVAHKNCATSPAENGALRGRRAREETNAQNGERQASSDLLRNSSRDLAIIVGARGGASSPTPSLSSSLFSRFIISRRSVKKISLAHLLVFFLILPARVLQTVVVQLSRFCQSYHSPRYKIPKRNRKPF